MILKAYDDMILVKVSNLEHYKKQPNRFKNFVEENGEIIAAISLATIGSIVGIYDLIIYFKSPLKKQYDNMEQQNRDKKLKDLGILD